MRSYSLLKPCPVNSLLSCVTPPQHRRACSCAYQAGWSVKRKDSIKDSHEVLQL